MSVAAVDIRRVSFGTHRRPKRSGKYNAVKVVFEGERFDSKRECERWQQLRLLERAMRIRNLRRQVTFRMVVNNVRVTTYRADFVYDEYTHGEWRQQVEDSKGCRDRRWPMVRKLMLACHGIEIRES